MVCNILGINPTHHASSCLLKDGELQVFIEEERLTRKKYDWNPYKSILSLLQTNGIDYISFGTPSKKYPQDNNTLFQHYPSYWHIFSSKFNPTPIIEKNYSDYHHGCHVAHAFYNSGFKKAIGVVIDGLGSDITTKNKKILGKETETIFRCSYPSEFKVLYKNFTTFQNQETNLSRVYETVTMHLGWSRDEAGKTMGLAPYGKPNPTIPNIFQSNQGNPNIFFFDPHKSTYLPNQNFYK
jgi:carbamoyltransferase